ncbi:MAG: Gfo/Idh/MocA family oxidoreductase, partial [Myxococcales bacterium]|nr:Gfo/Idh/MocA family oxidoreductase [Myxococcales bacterium]
LEYEPVLKAVCARSEDRLKSFADQWGYESFETDWRKLIAREDIDAIDICTPNNLHKAIALAAAAAGKMILCEKPLAMNPAEAQEMVEAVEAAGVANTVWYNYRRVPAVTLAKQLIDEGRLGRIFHYRAVFLQDWTIAADLPQGGEGLWRLDVAAAGSGVTGDLLAHCIDTAIWLNGSIKTVSAMTETFIKERMRAEDAVYGGEMSAHHYFRDFSYCDSGMIPWLLVSELMSIRGQKLSELVAERMEKFPVSGEINRRLEDPVAMIARVKSAFEGDAISVDLTDGLTLEFDEWRFNVRSSNTEPVVRLNVESKANRDLMAEKTKAILDILGGEPA